MSQIELRTDNKKTSENRAISRTFIYEIAFLCFHPELSVMSASADSFSVDEIPKEQHEEIRTLCRSYTSKILVCGSEERLFLICPTLYPASSICLVLKMTLQPKQLLRLIEMSDTDRFIISKHLKLSSARLSDRIRELSDTFFDLCHDLEQCFMHLGCVESVSVSALTKLCLDISEFTGCPIEIDTDGNDATMGNLDLPMVASFVTNMFALIRKCAANRSAHVKISILYGAPFVQISFDWNGSLSLVEDYYRWRNITDEKDMHLYLYEHNGVVAVSLHFYRIDPSLFGLKSPLMFKQEQPKWMM